MKSMRRVGAWVVTAVLCLPAVMLADTAVDPLIQKVEQRYNGAKTLSVTFVENYSVQGRHRPAESGTLTLRKQGKMRWDYTKPEGKVFVSDGKNLYLFTSWDNRVEKIPLKDTEDMRAPLAFLLGHLDLKKEFRNFTLQAKDDEEWLTASAKNDKTPYQSIQMLIKRDGEITQLKVLGRDTSNLEFSLSQERLNPPVNNNVFAFKIPPGAEVVNAAEYTGEGQ
jgi:outer membrane lipoprotein carrier protein